MKRVRIEKIAQAIRLISLAVLFGGSAAIVFAAITLVHAATAAGVPLAEAATRNVPVFFSFSKIVLVFSFLLLFAESIDFTNRNSISKLVIGKYLASGICIASAMIFTIGIIPPLQALLPQIANNIAAHQQFTQLHKISQAVFGITILSALISLLIPSNIPDHLRREN
jgi:hypothetical protein